MSEKRKPTTRYQGERPPKRRHLSPPSPPPAPKQPTHRQPANPPEKKLPVKLKETQDLPTQAEKQSIDISNHEYQSIAESGVLAASIHQSRQRWVTNGIFDRYWTRPSKKRGPADTPNPAKESMTRHGTCSMIIEPHVFETTLYTVKDHQSSLAFSQLPPHPPPAPSNSTYNSYQDHRTYQSQMHTSHIHGNHPQHYQQHTPGSPNLTLPPFREGFGQFSSQGSPPCQLGIPPRRPVEQNQLGDIAIHNDAQATVDESEKPTDPVIQMLATRAASDHKLKALMKIVASGHASQDQLREFQNHIDELNRLIKCRDNSTRPDMDQQTRAPPSQSQIYSASSSPPPLPQPPVPLSSKLYTALPSASIHIKSEPQIQAQPPSNIAQLPRPQSAVTMPYKPEVTSMVFEFSSSGDRYLFPRFSILEFLHGGTQVLASFLIIRKGSAATCAEYNKTTTYYQPVTIRLSTSNPKLFEPLVRVVAPPEEVTKYMNGIFDKMSPAHPAHLVTRLPRAKEDEDTEMKDALV
ncbi:MAG: hypothetical protein LQ341_002928 [Variospora aurantia]|nr:MAG: hypothetical protein LQ341_002928 [Variospora aurantia]